MPGAWSVACSREVSRPCCSVFFIRHGGVDAVPSHEWHLDRFHGPPDLSSRGETPRDVVRYFYQTTRPFGFWKPFWSELSEEEKVRWSREHRFDGLTVVCTLVWQVLLFLIPMQVLTHNWSALAGTAPAFLLCCVGLYFFWYKNFLPSTRKSPTSSAGRRSIRPRSFASLRRRFRSAFFPSAGVHLPPGSALARSRENYGSRHRKHSRISRA